MIRIGLVGYGKMGQTIEKIAVSKGHTISKIIDQDNIEEIDSITPENTDVVIEFTRPESAFQNLSNLISNKVPVVCGTTGWLEKKPDIDQLTNQNDTAFFYASNYSIGVNIFFHMNKVLAKMMDGFDQYNVAMEEIHHIHKLDEPSGTAITLSEGITENMNRKSTWKLNQEQEASDIAIVSKREGEVPGTHIISYQSDIDTIEIKHEAHNRQGFAGGAVIAAEWLYDKKGVFGMNDMLKF